MASSVSGCPVDVALYLRLWLSCYSHDSSCGLYTPTVYPHVEQVSPYAYGYLQEHRSSLLLMDSAVSPWDDTAYSLYAMVDTPPATTSLLSRCLSCYSQCVAVGTLSHCITSCVVTGSSVSSCRPHSISTSTLSRWLSCYSQCVAVGAVCHCITSCVVTGELYI